MDPTETERRAYQRLSPISISGFPNAEELQPLHDQHGFFRVYVVGRSAALGGGPRLTHAATALFPYGLVRNAFDRVAEASDLEEFRAACVDAYAAAGDRLYADASDAEEVAERLEQLADLLDHSGRPLSASWASLPRPDGVGARIERAATIIREHRGGAHYAILLAHGLVGPDALLLTALWRGDDETESSARYFGWRDDDIAASWERLGASGRVDADREISDAGREEREAIEDLTVALAAARWEAIDPADRARTVELLESLPPPR